MSTSLLMEPRQVPGGSWIVQCLDPQGAMFGMIAGKRCAGAPARLPPRH